MWAFCYIFNFRFREKSWAIASVFVRIIWFSVAYFFVKYAKHIGFSFLKQNLYYPNKWCLITQKLRFYHAIHKSLPPKTQEFRCQYIVFFTPNSKLLHPNKPIIAHKHLSFYNCKTYEFVFYKQENNSKHTSFRS